MTPTQFSEVRTRVGGSVSTGLSDQLVRSAADLDATAHDNPLATAASLALVMGAIHHRTPNLNRRMTP